MNLPPLVAEALSDRGLKHFTNEDAFTFQLPSTEHSHGLFLIADGVSSLGKSDVASQLAADIARETYYNAPDSLDMATRVDQAIQAASAALREAAVNENLDRMGTTIAGIALGPTGDGIVFNVGDSRVYQIRNKQIKQLSKDQVSTQQAGTLFSIEPKRRSTKLSAFVGQSRPLEAVIVPFQAKSGDIYLICTDGLWSLVTEQELYEISTSFPIAQANRKFIDTAKERGAPDNVTIMTIRVGLPAAPRRTGVIISGIVVVILAVALILFGVKALGDRSQTTAIAAAGTTETLSSPNPSGTAAALAIPAGTLTLEVSATSELAIPAVTLAQTATMTPIPPTATKQPTTLPPTIPTTVRTPTIGIVEILRTPTSTRGATTVAPTATTTNTMTILPPTATNTSTVSPTKGVPSQTATATLTIPPTVTHLPTATATATSTKTTLDTATATLSETPMAVVTTTITVNVSQRSVSSSTPQPTNTITPTNTATTTTTLTNTATSSPTTTASATNLLKFVVTPSSVQISTITPTFTPTPIIRFANITLNGVRIRTGDSLDHIAIGTFNKGDIVMVLGVDIRNQGWYLVKTQSGLLGWVASNYIEFKKTTLNDPVVPYVDPLATEMTYTPSPSPTLTPTLTDTTVADPGNTAP